MPLGESRERFYRIEGKDADRGGGSRRATASTAASISSSRARNCPAKPFKSFKGRTYAAAVSPESAREIMAKLGISILIIRAEAVEAVAQELNEYRTIYKQVNGGRAAADDRGGMDLLQRAPTAREMAVKYIGGYWDTALRHTRWRRTFQQGQRLRIPHEQMAKNTKGNASASIGISGACRCGARPDVLQQD